MAYMCCLFRGAVLGLEVQCLKELGLRLRDHTVVVPGRVQVMIEMIMDSVRFACLAVISEQWPKVSQEILRLPFIPLWSPFSVLQNMPLGCIRVGN